MTLERKQKERPKNVLPKPGLLKKELKKRKTPFSNTYINPDGSFTTEVSSTPINYKNRSGNWRSIDNRLITKTEGGYDYENTANAFRVKFAHNNFDGRLVFIELDPTRWLAFTPTDRFTQTGTIRDNSVFYKGIRVGVDLEYIVDGDSLKERIILNSPGSNVFKFELSYQGLRLEKDGEGIIWAIDSDTGNRLMHFQKSYAEDAQGKVTQNINTDIATEAGKEMLVLTIDNTWLASAAYPVIVDPSLVISLALADPNNIQDAYIAGGYPTTNYSTNNYLHVGYLAGYNYMRSLIKFNYLPSLPLGAKITGASLDMFMYLGSTGGTTIDLFAVTSPWDINQVNWSNQPQTGSALITGFTATPNTLWQMNIISLVKDWYQGNLANYGVMLKATNESSPKISFYSANEPTYTKPKLVINYEIDALGMDPYFTFHENVNVHNGNLVLSDVDAELPGRGVPINVTRVYNLRSELSAAMGYRWTLNVYRRIKYANTDMVHYTDADGSTMTFTKGPDGSYRPPVGLQANLFYSNGVFYIEEKSGLRHYFNSTGKLDRITDTNNNSTVISYLTDGNIDKITDVSGRQVVFGYTGGKLTNITGSSIATVEYTYTGNLLTGMKKKDDAGNILAEETYGYDIWNNMVTITDGLGNITTLAYSYTDDLGRRLYQNTQNLTIDSVVETLTTTYTYALGVEGITTTVTDPANKITEYKTNAMGNIMQVIEDKGGLNITTKHEWDEQQNLVETTEPKGVASPDPDNYRTVLDYNESGDVTRIINPEDFGTTYDYDTNSDPKETNDFGNKPEINDYDPNTRNLLTASDSLFSTSVMKYDAYGNTISQTNPIGIGDNRVINSGFETWNAGLPTGWTVYSLGGSINDDLSQKVNGDHSIRLESPGNLQSQITTILSDFIEVKELVRYNVSWYVKTLAAQSDYGNATADIHWYTDNKPEAWMGSSVNTTNAAPTKGSTDSFIRKGTQVSSPANARYARIALGVSGGPNNSPVTAWFDNVQFEMGSVINQYNLVYNADFELDMDEDDLPDGWVGLNLTASDVLDTAVTRSGKGRSMRVVGSAAAKSFSQEIKLTGTVNTPIHISGWSKAQGWSTTGGTYRMKLELYSDTTFGGAYVLDFPKTDTNWHLIEGVIYANSNFTMLKVYGMYENQSGTAWFDDFVVRLDEAPNAVMSAYNITQNGNFEVRDGALSWPDEWVGFHSATQGTYAMTWEISNSTVEAYSGDYMIKIANVPDWATVDNKIKEPIKAGITYTASAVIKTNNVSGSGAVLKFNILDSAGEYLDQKLSEVITGTRDWTRVVVTLSEAEAKAIHTNAARFRVAVGTIGATSGEMYFDAVRVLEGNLITNYTYDANGNYVTSVRDQLGNTTSMVNDNRGNASQVTDAKSNTMRYLYDKLDRLKQVENPRDLITAYFYDKEGNLTQIDNHQRTGPTTSAYINTAIGIQYNEQMLPKRITDGNWRATYLEYNRKKLLKTIKHPNGKQVHYLYDANDRPQSVTYTGDTNQWSFGYDANSNLTSATKNNTEITSYDYDNLNRVAQVTYPAVFNVSDNIQYKYNPNDKITSTQHSKLPIGAQQVKYEYDQADNNMIISGPNSTRAEFMYDEESRLKKSDVRISDSMNYSTYHNYNTAGRIIGMRTDRKNGMPVLDWSYFYDANGNRNKDVNNLTKKRIEYSYDSINQLTEERYYDDLTTNTASKSITYQYDLLGNRTEKTVIAGTTTTTTYSYNAANEITNVNGTPQYTHDFNGNMTGAYGYTFTYNAENQLIRIDLSGAEVARYEYDSKGLRTRKITPARTERFYYDGDQLAYVTEEIAGTSQNKLKYFFTRDTLGRLMHMIDYTAAAPKTYCYIMDVHGNVVALADENGNRVVNYEYDAWGNLTNTPEAVITGNGEYLRNANPFRYSSYQFDPESGLYYLKARYYSAAIGRFLTRDKVQSINLYSYCVNNPVNLIDPTGNLGEAAIMRFSAIYGLGLSGWLLSLKLGAFLSAVFPYLIGAIAVIIVGYLAYKAIQYAKRDTKQTGNVTSGMTKSQREAYNREIHDYKREHGMRPKDNLPYLILKEIADEIRRHYK